MKILCKSLVAVLVFCFSPSIGLGTPLFQNPTPDGLVANSYEMRNRFFKRFLKVEKGMTNLQVRAIVGLPDTVANSQNYDSEIWKFGVLKSGFSSLGEITFNKNGQVKSKHGNECAPDEKLTVFLEDELRSLIDNVFRSPNSSGQSYDPFQMIRTTNKLISLKKEKALSVLKEFSRVSCKNTDATEKVYLLLLCLNDSTSSYEDLPFIGLGEPFQLGTLKRSNYISVCPSFPISFLEGIPLLHTIDGYAPTSGTSRPIASHLAKIDDKVTFRSDRISITSAKESFLLESLQRYKDSPRWYFRSQTWQLGERDEHHVYDMFQEQIKRFVKSRTGYLAMQDKGK